MRTLGLSLFFSLSIVAAACGGKIDDGDAGTEAGSDAPTPPPICKPNNSSCTTPAECCTGACTSGLCGGTTTCTPNYQKCAASKQCCSQICDPQSGVCMPNVPPPPGCQPDGTPCGSPSQCCSLACNGGYCGGPQPPPPPPCKQGGSPCSSGGECCSSMCVNNVCAGSIACGSTSTKLCDQCVDSSCCPQVVTCNNNGVCSQWLACVQNCEQKGYSAFACTQNACGAPSTPTESALYSCAQQYCSTQCTKD